jgi:hypothetical protein
VLTHGVPALMADQVDLHEPGHRVVQSAQVRIGIWSFSSDPGLVWLRPRTLIDARAGANLRSIVEAPIASSASATSSVTCSSPNRRNRGTRSVITGFSRLPVGAPRAFLAWLRCHPVVAHSSSRIRPLSALLARLYRVAIAFVTALRCYARIGK